VVSPPTRRRRGRSESRLQGGGVLRLVVRRFVLRRRQIGNNARYRPCRRSHRRTGFVYVAFVIDAFARRIVRLARGRIAAHGSGARCPRTGSACTVLLAGTIVVTAFVLDELAGDGSISYVSPVA
jgi:hypothetical protein